MIYGRQTKTAMLAEKLKSELLAERLPKDTPVMSARELADRFGVSVNTADRILALLVKQGFLYRRERSGSFIKNDPPVIPSIAYAGYLPDPEVTNPIKYDAIFRLLEHFTELGIKPKLITLHTLRHPELAEQELGKTNGLLIDAAFIDNNTLKTLWNYPGKIMIIGACYIEEKLPCSQVIPDLTNALLEFDSINSFAGYDKILLVHSSFFNSIARLKMIRSVLERRHFPEQKIETVMISCSGNVNAYLRASRYFSQCGDFPEKTLIISMSEYFSQAAREVFSGRKSMPDILNIDNMEAYVKDSDAKPWFTSIDCQAGTAACRALDLLCEQLKTPSRERMILRIPTELVIRESVKNNEKKDHPAIQISKTDRRKK